MLTCSSGPVKSLHTTGSETAWNGSLGFALTFFEGCVTPLMTIAFQDKPVLAVNSITNVHYAAMNLIGWSYHSKQNPPYLNE